ncbi:MAG: hypothetical protein JST17_12895 [Bacteroidetes bacterium]|nr:hypothetical protein [Bacteroidota bacterium]MBS1930543.1 hypothetical protein [Bacteroidota bacterium]
METHLKKIRMPLSLLAICMALFSFSSRWGGEGFEIYLNNKLLLQQFGSSMSAVKTIQLDQRFSKETLTVKYYHCEQAGKNRRITIKDEQGKNLKVWNFADSKNTGLNLSVHDILALQHGANKNPLNLFYSSSELPKGRLLVSIEPERAYKTIP